jgi:carbamoyl-phosphate synthase large subunit
LPTEQWRAVPALLCSIRRVALEYNLPYTTTIAAARATLDAIRAMKKGKLEVRSLQEHHELVKKNRAS